MADAKTAKEVCTGSNIDQRRIRIDYSRVSRSPTAHRRRREREYDSRSPSLTRRPPSPARSERYSGKSRSSSRSSSPKNRRMRSRSRSRSRSGSRGRRPDKPPQSRCIGVFGLSVYTTQQRIREVFSKFGPIERIQVVIDAQTGRSRGFCFIYYESEADAKEAKDSCSGMELDSRRIRVDYSITERPHSPTPGVYMGRPTRSFRQREYRERYREEYRPRRYASPPPPYDFHHHHARIRYERAYEDRSMSPPR